jgi:hypothetical protein
VLHRSRGALKFFAKLSFKKAGKAEKEKGLDLDGKNNRH